VSRRLRQALGNHPPDPLTLDPLTLDPLTPGPLTPGPLTPGPLSPGSLSPGSLSSGPLSPGPLARRAGVPAWPVLSWALALLRPLGLARRWGPPASGSPERPTSFGRGFRRGGRSHRFDPAPSPLPGPLVLDLLAALVQGGAAPGPALRSVGTALERAGDPRASPLLSLAARVDRPGAGPAPASAEPSTDRGSRVFGAPRGAGSSTTAGAWSGRGIDTAGGAETSRDVDAVGDAEAFWGARASWGAVASGGAATSSEVRALRDVGVSAAAAGERSVRAVEEALWLAGRAGLAPTALIRRAAEEQRRREQAAAIRAVRRVEVLLVIPAGLCLLPAFVLLGIVPVVLDLVLG
jgi:hypothetical protein